MSAIGPATDDSPADGAGEADGAGDPGRELLVMRLGEAHFGLWIDEVLEIAATPPISKLPLAVPEVAGVTGIRGDVVPVLDLGVRLLGEPAARPGRLVLLRHRESDSIVALLVDAVETMESVQPGEVGEAPREAAAALPAGMIEGIVARPDRVITILRSGGVAAPPAASTEEE